MTMNYLIYYEVRMKLQIYNFDSYRKFLVCAAQSEIDRGSKGRLAKAAACNPSWMTKVLGEEAHLTPDQAFGVCAYLGFSESETDYFMGLVELERAATPALHKRIQRKLNELKIKTRNLGTSIKSDAELTLEQRTLYYSSWVYPALHVASLIPNLSIEDISSRLGLSSIITNQTLLNLKEMGLVSKQPGRWCSTSKNIHLDSTDPLASGAHRNWRSQTIHHLQIQNTNAQGLHYSAIHALSKNDIETIRTLLKDAILDCRKIIDRSSTETLGILCMDWYDPNDCC